MSKFIAREYIGGGVVVFVELEDDNYLVVVEGLGDHPEVRAEAVRARPALRKFAEVVADLGAQFEAQGWRWKR
jgi:hypothetical protein